MDSNVLQKYPRIIGNGTLFLFIFIQTANATAKAAIQHFLGAQLL